MLGISSFSWSPNSAESRETQAKVTMSCGNACITNVASARRDFMEEYPTFDVVIIDEVSKATPPELLLPMLKGKKIISHKLLGKN